MKIGIVVSANRSSGGIYQYTASILKALYQWDTNNEFVICVWLGNPLPLDEFVGPRWRIETMDPRILSRNEDIRPYLAGDGLDLSRPGVNTRAREFFSRHRIDLLVYPAPQTLSFECGVPYIMAIHDLQHRLQPEFPEVSAGEQWQFREYLFRNGVRYAQGVLVDSEVGKEDALTFYGDYISSERVYSLPFLPSYRPGEDGVADAQKAAVREKYQLPARYLFYPAQFWLHKNHARLIHAIHQLRAVHQVDTPLILVGSNSGGPKEEARELVFQNAMLLAEQLGVQDLVRYLGYVPDEDMPALYTTATALTMPTFFGPTNIPILEAWAFDCPVLTSDVRGIREQVDGAGLLVDPRNVKAIADGILQLWTDNGLRHSLAAAGRKRLNSFQPEDFASKLYSIIEDVRRRLEIKAWLGQELRIKPVPGSGGMIDINGVQGFLIEGDAHYLFDKARALPANAVIVEIGSFMGLSAIVMANGLVASCNDGARIYCVDTWEGSPEHQNLEVVENKQLYDVFSANVQHAGVSSFIHPIRKRSTEAAADFAPQSVDLLFVDGDHSFESCYADLEAWYPKLRPGGVLIGHDCIPNGGVRKAVEKFASEHGFAYSIIEPPAAHYIFEMQPRTQVKEPLISAIVSTYNAERFIRGCLEDLEAQTIANQLEIIVVDSGSQQNERAIVEEFQQRYDNIVYIRTEEREGVYAAWNRGIRAARGKYITNANTDDRHRKDALERMVNVLEARPDIALVYANLYITQTENQTFENHTPVGAFRWLDFDPVKLIYGCFIGPQPMWRKSLHDKYGYFDESFESAGDWEFWLRMAETEKFFHLDEFLGLYLKSPASVEHRNRDLSLREARRVQQRYLPRVARLQAERSVPLPTGGVGTAGRETTLVVPTTAVAAKRDDLRTAGQPLAELFEAGQAALERDDLETAAGEFAKVTEQHPDLAAGHTALGSTLMALGRIEEAIPVLRRAAELVPQEPALHNQLGIALYQLEEFDAAEEAFQAALEAVPDGIDALLNLVELCRAQERYAEATEYVKRALQVAPHDAGVLTAFGTLSLELGDGEAAGMALQRLQAIEPNQPAAQALEQILNAV